MKYFKVVALTCSGRGKKIHRGGEIVPEDQFEPKALGDLIARKFIVEASKEDMKAWKEAGNKTVEEKIEDNKKESKEAEEAAEKELEAVKADYMALADVKAEDLNGSWGVPKFTKEVKALLTAKYNELAGDDAEDVIALSNEELKTKIAELESQN